MIRKLGSNGARTILLNVSAKYRSAKEASHQPAFMGSYLPISHTCLTCLPSRGVVLVFLVLLKEVRTLCWCKPRVTQRNKLLGRVAFRILSSIHDGEPARKQPTVSTSWLFSKTKRPTTDAWLDSKCTRDWKCCKCGMKANWNLCMEFVTVDWCTVK